MISLLRSHDGRQLGWDQFSEEPGEIHVVPGDHLTMITEPYVQILAERLKAYLNEVCDVRQPQEL